MIKEGKYLFVYSEINKVLNVLGHSLRHDHNLAVFEKKDQKVTLVCHIEFERFSGIKHHNIAFYNKEEAGQYIDEMLKPFYLSMKDFVGVYGINGLTHEDYFSYSSIDSDSRYSYHAISHLYSSFLNMKEYYENDVISLAYDGGPDSLVDEGVFHKPLFCGAFSKKGDIKLFPISSPGGYWLYVSNYFDMPEGTLMALAYATKAKSMEIFEALPDYIYLSDKRKCIESLQKIINRIMGYTDDDQNVLYVTEDGDERFSEAELKISMIMKIIQDLSIQNVFYQIDQIIEDYNINPSKTILSLSGGYALNCPTNSTIMKKYKFKEMMCAPCVNDGGLSIGMGLYFFKKMMIHFEYKFQGAYYGYSDFENVEKTLKQHSAYIDNVQEGISEIPYDIEKYPIIWLDGRAEIGPRALGNRSIIANPNKEGHKELLNKYKQREWWRPVAPIILEDDLEAWFEHAYTSPYMLNNFNVKSSKEKSIEAVLHLDKTARVQTLSSVDNKKLYEVIKKFKELTGIPMVCNTSLNDKGEPIINTLEQAINFGLRKKINIIYAYGKRIQLKNFEHFKEKKCTNRNDKLFVYHREEKEALLKEINPYHLSQMNLLIYLFNPTLRKMDLTKEEEFKKIFSILKKLKLIDSKLLVFEGWSSTDD